MTRGTPLNIRLKPQVFAKLAELEAVRGYPKSTLIALAIEQLHEQQFSKAKKDEVRRD